MPRSQTIWVVVDIDSIDHYGPLIAAFTVKHELKTWLDHNRWEWASLKLFRCPDSPHWMTEYYKAPEEIDIQEVMK